MTSNDIDAYLVVKCPPPHPFAIPTAALWTEVDGCY